MAEDKNPSPESHGHDKPSPTPPPPTPEVLGDEPEPEQVQPSTNGPSFIPPVSVFKKDIDFLKEETAKIIAQYVVRVFMYSILSGIGGVLVVVLVCFFWQTSNAATPLVKDALIPFLQALGTFATTVFGPLLAFILGYYFGGGKGTKPQQND